MRNYIFPSSRPYIYNLKNMTHTQNPSCNKEFIIPRRKFFKYDEGVSKYSNNNCALHHSRTQIINQFAQEFCKPKICIMQSHALIVPYYKSCLRRVKKKVSQTVKLLCDVIQSYDRKENKEDEDEQCFKKACLCSTHVRR